MSSEKSVDAIDLSHHLSAIARARVTSPLKGLAKYLGKPGVISLAGGLPNEAYFPLSSVSGEVLVPDSFPLEAAQEPSSLSWFWNLFTKSKAKERTTRFTVSRFSDNPDDLTLATSLQYGMAKGLPQLNAIIKELTEKVYKPAYSNFTTLVHTGNTDGISKAAWTLCNPGEGVLVSEWTYPSAMATVEYQRKKEIYDICVEFGGVDQNNSRRVKTDKRGIDVIIVEDDPYYFLQSGPYAPQEERRDQPDISTLTDEEYIAQLVPSYLKLDYQGRVIRLDTFSKTIAPGSRLGWFTCNPMFAERIERASETSTQAPCGFALRIQYKQRRDYFIDCLGRDFHLQRTFARDGFREGAVVYEGFLKSQNTFISEKSIVSSQRVFSFIPPTSGMFIWLQLHLEHHPLHGKIDTTALELKLWTSLAEAGLIIGPGDIFSAHPGQNGNSKHGHFRISFSNSEFDVMKKAVRIFSTILQQFMADTTISM
uniref:PLP-dependent transferase n=1 Tax=Moniliophthora roreri TaxID=221103 RepID=A0A0W0FCP6_MONRR